MKNLFLVFLALVPIFDHIVLGENNWSKRLKEEELTGVITIETQGGDVVDCVDIYKQISLTHPLLKNHVIQMKPSWRTDDNSSAYAERYGPIKVCPKKTVPILRTNMDLGQKIKTSDQHRVNAAYDDTTLKYGAGAELNVYNLNVGSGQFSSHNIWVEGNVSGHLSMIIAGWRVEPALFGDSRTRIFTYWTGDNYRNGCYNTLCAGYIQVDRAFHPGMTISPMSTYGGKQFIIKLDIKQDRTTGHWWLILHDQYALGYWPSEVIPNLQGGATLLAWGGISKAGEDGICPPLGNGHKPDTSLKALFLRSLTYIDSKNHIMTPSNEKLRLDIDKSGCYGLYLEPKTTTVYLGGPGGCRCGA